MGTRLGKLPLGIQTFEEIREDDYIYVDKTGFLVDLIDTGKVYFYARPRRFGKSLTVSTLDAMFSGKKKLFEGLYAEEFMNRPDYHTSPVIRLDMSKVTSIQGIDVFRESLMIVIRKIAANLGVSLSDITVPGNLFGELIENTFKKYGSKVVILLDEYDKPYNEYVDNSDIAKNNRDVLRDLYIQIKANDEYIRFVFITGIAKFARFGVFSSLNNINDLSMNKKYGEMCGLTETEIIRCFPEHIEATALGMNITSTELLERMRNYYDGFCFDGTHKLYNPFSTLYFFTEKKFNNYWIESGTPSMIAKYLKDRKLTVEQFRNIPISNEFLRTPGEMDTTVPVGFLYQGGYLTIREETLNDYTLDYPNTEVLNSMSALLAQNILSPNNSLEDLRQLMLSAFVKNKPEILMKTINSLLASIPYDDFTKAGQTSVIVNDYPFQAQEWLYRSTIIAFMRGCGVATVAEMHTNLGRADLVISDRGNTYVIELKVAYKPEDVKTKLNEAVEQMTEKNYLTPYPIATGLAMVIDDTERQITEMTIVEQ